jgi:hypothetical protein
MERMVLSSSSTSSTSCSNPWFFANCTGKNRVSHSQTLVKIRAI